MSVPAVVPAVVPLFARPDLPGIPPRGAAASPSRPEPAGLGYGVCKSWSLCGCRGYRGYRGDGTRSCQSCGHGFGAHY